MPFRIVFLATDVLIYILVFAACAFAFYASRHEHLRAPWRQVVQRPLGMGAAVVLATFVLIGLLDAIHLEDKLPDQNHYTGEVLSVLDRLGTPIRTHVEKTYSAPFAIHAYSKETIERPVGGLTREYPRLVYGGAHLHHASERLSDITQRSLVALLEAIATWAGIVGVFSWRLRKKGESFDHGIKRLTRGESEIPWRTILATLGLVIVCVSFVINLGPHYHILGTDQVGNDVLFNSIKSIRTGLVIGTLTTLVMLPFALVFGVMAGYFRGWVDDVIQYTYTTLSSIPPVLLIVAAVLSLDVYLTTHEAAVTTIAQQADLRLLLLCMILGVTSWTSLCRLLRGETLKLREVDYVQAATALGVGHTQIMARHIVPNVMHIVLITIVLDFSGLVLIEAVLTYIGVGVGPSMNSWGNMINGARLEMAREPIVWWSLTAAFVFMFGLVLAANLFADAVRDAFDPRLRT